MILKLTNVRLAFPKLFKAEAVNGEGEPKFGCSLLLEPTDAQIKAINQAINAAAVDKWGAKAAGHLALMRKTDKVFLHDGNLKAQYAGFENMLYVSCNSAVRPVIVDRNKAPLTEADGRPYGGCYVNVTMDTWAQDNKFGKRVNAQLMSVQFVRDGDAFGGGRIGSADDFEDITDGVDAAADLV